SRTLCRAASFPEGATESSRSRISASAPQVIAFANFFSLSPGTKSRERMEGGPHDQADPNVSRTFDGSGRRNLQGAARRRPMSEREGVKRSRRSLLRRPSAAHDRIVMRQASHRIHVETRHQGLVEITASIADWVSAQRI